MITVGAFVADFDSRMAINPVGIEGNKSISIEDDLGLKSSKARSRWSACLSIIDRHPDGKLEQR